MPYYYEDDYAIYGGERIESALKRWRPGAFRTFTSAAEESFSQYNTLGYLSSGLAEWTAEDNTPIEEENWNSSHPSHREDIGYTDGLTEGEALARATQSDRNNNMAFVRQNVDFWSLPNLSGTFLGGMPDPVNLAGLGGFVGRMGKVSKIAKKMPVVKYAAPVLQGTADTVLAESLFQFTRSAVTASQGGDLDQFSMLSEIGLSAVFGGVFSTLPMAWQIAKKAPDAMHFTWLAEARNEIGRQGGPVTIFGREGMEEAASDTTTARQKNEEILQELESDDLGETVGEGDQLFQGERRDLDERSWTETVADDLRDSAADPGSTLRNAYEKITNCYISTVGKFSKRF